MTECNKFQELGTMSLYDMQQVATIMEIGPKGKIGFIKPGHPDHKRYRDMDLED